MLHQTAKKEEKLKVCFHLGSFSYSQESPFLSGPRINMLWSEPYAADQQTSHYSNASMRSRVVVVPFPQDIFGRIATYVQAEIMSSDRHI